MEIRKRGKKGKLLYEMIMHLILIALVFALFFISTTWRANSNSVKQQIIEKQTALLIDSAMPGVSLIIAKQNRNGLITKLELKGGKVFAYVDDNGYTEGYDYFTRHNVELIEEDDKYMIKVSGR